MLERATTHIYFFYSDYSPFKYCPSLLEAVGIPDPTQNFRDFSLFTDGFSRETGKPATSALAAMLFMKMFTYLINRWSH